jgi:Domain of unknown function (DUF3576)
LLHPGAFMRFHRRFNAALVNAALALLMVTSLAACGGGGASSGGLGGILGGNGGAERRDPAVIAQEQTDAALGITRTGPGNRSTLRDLFRKGDDPNTTVKVNKYIWEAALDVLNFLPVEQVDPFTGVIVTGYGRPPGGGRAYRATIYVQDPALDARSLKLAMQTQGGGAVDPATIRAIEDAILTRARELRIADGKL